MNTELPFPGFEEHIARPLAKTDSRSFSLIRRFFIGLPHAPHQPFSLLIHKLTGRKMNDSEALTCWMQLLNHKVRLQQKLGRTVGIQTAAIDYFEYQSPTEPYYRKSDNEPTGKSNESVVPKNHMGGDYNLEKLKEEILRAKRYRHALSILLIDIDHFHEVNNRLGYNEGDRILSTIVQITRKIIRNVDFLTRLSGDRFLLILPNTNHREAKELAERIRIQISERTRRLKSIQEGMTATMAVAQCNESDTSITFIRRTEHTLHDGRQKKTDTVYSCP